MALEPTRRALVAVPWLSFSLSLLLLAVKAAADAASEGEEDDGEPRVCGADEDPLSGDCRPPPPVEAEGGVELLTLMVFIIMLSSIGVAVYFLGKRSQSTDGDDFFDKVTSWREFELPKEIEEFYAVKESVDQDTEEGKRHLAKALFRRAVADIPSIRHMEKEGRGIGFLHRKSMVGGSYQKSFQDHQKIVNEEFHQVQCEAEDLHPGWGESIFREANQHWMQIKAQRELQAKQEEATKGKSEKEKKVILKKLQEEQMKEQRAKQIKAHITKLCEGKTPEESKKIIAEFNAQQKQIKKDEAELKRRMDAARSDEEKGKIWHSYNQMRLRRACEGKNPEECKKIQDDFNRQIQAQQQRAIAQKKMHEDRAAKAAAALEAEEAKEAEANASKKKQKNKAKKKKGGK